MRRLFSVYAIVSLVPVVVLGVVLVVLLRAQADAQGLSAGRSKAKLIATASIAPLLDGHLVDSDFLITRRDDIEHAMGQIVRGGAVSRIRMRSLTGDVIFSSDASSPGAADEDAFQAAHGKTVAHLTRLNDDFHNARAQGPRAVEVYEPVTDTHGNALGVLELYLPYAPIATQLHDQEHQIEWALAAGLLLLWLSLSAVSFSLSRRLRRHARTNAHLASHDTLTGLPNRTRFVELAEHAVAAATSAEFVAVAVVDLDRFKEVNDTLGYRNGDRLLIQMAERLSRHVQSGDTVARLGGDGFGLVLRRRTSVDEVRGELSAIRAVISAHAMVDDLPLVVEASIGFTLAPEDGTDIDIVLQHVDLAMYAAKRGGHDVVRYRPEHDHYNSSALLLLAELGAAIADGQLVLHYQPKGDLLTGTVTAVEALVRWQHPTRGLLGPDAFVPAAEETELIDELTRWVLATATAALPSLQPQGGLAMAVNVSARSLLRADFADEVLAILQRNGTDPANLILEITETALVVEPLRAKATLERLHASGVRVSIDDFGAGQTSLCYLAMLPITELKIDKAFVLGMLTDPRKAAIVRSVIQLGHSLNLTVTAEGVETVEALRRLIGKGCDTVQGYLLSRPVERTDVAERMAHASEVLRSAAHDTGAVLA